MIEMYLFEQLDAVAKYGTLVAASEQLHITQPSMSRAMKSWRKPSACPCLSIKAIGWS